MHGGAPAHDHTSSLHAYINLLFISLNYFGIFFKCQKYSGKQKGEGLQLHVGFNFSAQIFFCYVWQASVGVCVNQCVYQCVIIWSTLWLHNSLLWGWHHQCLLPSRHSFYPTWQNLPLLLLLHPFSFTSVVLFYPFLLIISSPSFLFFMLLFALFLAFSPSVLLCRPLWLLQCQHLLVGRRLLPHQQIVLGDDDKDGN